jgi:hypothetical protein
VAPLLSNILRPLAPTLRINIRLGDLDLVFDPVATILGKKQRLQALGYYYEVITGPAAGNAVTQAYTDCLAAWSQARATATGAAFANAAAAETDMQAQIRNFVVEGGALPAKGGRARVMLPGTLTFNVTNDLGSGGVADGNPLPSIRFQDEGTLWTSNPAMGKIPIIGLVEEQVNGAWIPSPKRWIHFQLIAPFYDNAAGELAAVSALRNQSEQGNAIASNIVPGVGPQSFMQGTPPPVGGAYGFNFNANDPQRYNCHSSRGGKRGLAITGNVLDSLPVAKFAGMNATQASGRPNAVKAQTNASGEAGVMLLPSRMGGDVYRLRIFVDPIGIFASDGTGAKAVVQETGRFEVTKHILWSRHILKPMPVLPAANTAKGVQARLSILNYDVGAVDGLFWNRSENALKAFQRNNHPPLPINGDMTHAATQAALNAAVTTYLANCGTNLGAINFGTIAAMLTQMQCVMDSTAAQATPVLSAAEYQAAIRWARAQAHANQATFGLSQNYNINAMVEDMFDTPHLIVIRHPAYYNRTRGPGVPAAGPLPPVPPAPALPPGTPAFSAYYQDAASLMYADGGLLELLLRYFNGNASVANPPNANLTRYSTPGLTVIRALAQAVTMFDPAQPGQVQVVRTTGASGIAMKERGCYVFYGATIYVNWPYQGDGLSKNTRHEMGHTLYLRHHKMPSKVVSGVFHTGLVHGDGDFHEDHDNADRCVMGYLFCEGEYCGKCQLKIRGWDISGMPV